MAPAVTKRELDRLDFWNPDTGDFNFMPYDLDKFVAGGTLDGMPEDLQNKNFDFRVSYYVVGMWEHCHLFARYHLFGRCPLLGHRPCRVAQRQEIKTLYSITAP